ncbi:hypothetical protein EJ03DRAFT_354564 [Teratosphaeria nubilosa]|uniref:CCHC-type domain-containing protein n=1 Tax=Teratosphaeria nubilosa TaxID=161662 RepID=A0A6G1KYQ7_9PEZI|nr:hypothetical protein EJ03DRAFT_354564 [Teratosphaeria nubilosa]
MQENALDQEAGSNVHTGESHDAGMEDNQINGSRDEDDEEDGSIEELGGDVDEEIVAFDNLLVDPGHSFQDSSSATSPMQLLLWLFAEVSRAAWSAALLPPSSFDDFGLIHGFEEEFKLRPFFFKLASRNARRDWEEGVAVEWRRDTTSDEGNVWSLVITGQHTTDEYRIVGISPQRAQAFVPLPPPPPPPPPPSPAPAHFRPIQSRPAPFRPVFDQPLRPRRLAVPRACRNCEQVGHTQQDCPFAKMLRCGNCGSLEHFARHCQDPADRVRCAACGRRGHLKKECLDAQKRGEVE